MDGKKLSIAIPASTVSDIPHLREKTSKIGLIGRAAAIFRVNEIIIYQDNVAADQTREINLITTLLSFLETPQYLRKRLFKLRPELQYAGILPPLRTPHHPLKRRTKDLKIDDYREGVTLSQTREGTLIDIGVERPAMARGERLSSLERVTVKIVKIDNVAEVEMADRSEIQEYWGYIARGENRTLSKIIKKRGFDLTIATSKYGVALAKIAQQMACQWSKASTILVAFGAPTRGLHEIAKSEGFELEDIVDITANTLPLQGTETVRTEEAIIASLATFANIQAVESQLEKRSS